MDIHTETFATRFANLVGGSNASTQLVFPVSASLRALQSSASALSAQTALLLGLLLLLIGCLA
ncbi:MAG: hypothetical protein Q4G44_03170 [Alcaligenaceae bacterium]|nr:hypothetical protein [Alcaligenaceae bacterium]